MLIENESQWNTDDLRALTRLVMTKKGISEANLGARFLLVFRTCRQKSYGSEKGQPPKNAAKLGSVYRAGMQGHEGKVVEIYSKDRLMEKNALDRLVTNTANDVPQDLHPKHIRKIAQVIGDALSDHRYTDDTDEGYEWAEKCQLRAAPKITRSAEVLQRKIDQLEREKDRIRSTLNREIEKVDQQILKLEEKINKLKK